MGSTSFHSKPFDEGTLTKLDIFSLYAGEWLPVFLSRPVPPKSEVHVFDFFAGPGTDSVGTAGSPLRLLEEFRRIQDLPGWPKAKVVAHFFDANAGIVDRLQTRLSGVVPPHSRLEIDVRQRVFEDALQEATPILQDEDAAKLLLIDQFGVGQVTRDVFRSLVQAPTTDLLFFISSSTLHRFRDHPAIQEKIRRPSDSYHVHREVLEHYRSLLPDRDRYYLGSFSIRKGANIYGLIFGSAHPLGMDKFLQVAWRKDSLNGEADFDIHRDNVDPEQPKFQTDEFQPKKLWLFREELVAGIRNASIANEADVIRLCFRHGVLRRHASEILADLHDRKIADVGFRSPDIERLENPRPVTFISDPLF